MRSIMSTNTDTHNSSCGCLRRGCLKVVTIAIMLTANLYAQQKAAITLTDNWHIKQLETDKPDIQALIRQTASPDNTWLSAQMPAQVHDVLLQHDRISDPCISENAAGVPEKTAAEPVK